MSDTIVKMLKDNIRKTEADLANWRIEESKRLASLREAERMVGILSQGLDLLNRQLESLNERS